MKIIFVIYLFIIFANNYACTFYKMNSKYQKDKLFISNSYLIKNYKMIFRKHLPHDCTLKYLLFIYLMTFCKYLFSCYNLGKCIENIFFAFIKKPRLKYLGDFNMFDKKIYILLK